MARRLVGVIEVLDGLVLDQLKSIRAFLINMIRNHTVPKTDKSARVPPYERARVSLFGLTD